MKLVARIKSGLGNVSTACGVDKNAFGHQKSRVVQYNAALVQSLGMKVLFLYQTSLSSSVEDSTSVLASVSVAAATVS